MKYFLDAEETKPGFYTGNWLYLAKTYYQLRKYQDAKKWLQTLLEAPSKNVEDREVSQHIGLYSRFMLVPAVFGRSTETAEEAVITRQPTISVAIIFMIISSSSGENQSVAL